MNKRILCIGPNPAYQKTLVFGTFFPGEVNRAQASFVTSGGKGIHAARAANQLSPDRTSVAYFSGGRVGEMLKAILATDGIEQLIGEHPGETRTCTTILCRATDSMTELIEPSPSVSFAALAKLKKDIEEKIPMIKGLALCGTWPTGVSSDFYVEILRSTNEQIVILDAYKEVEPVLATGKVDYLKINIDELLMLTAVGNVESAAEGLIAEFGLKGVMVTAGAEHAYCFTASNGYRLRIPRLQKVVNPIGAGDTCTGVMLAKLVDGIESLEAFRWGLAAAIASCLHIEGAKFSCADMDKFHGQIVAEPFRVP